VAEADAQRFAGTARWDGEQRPDGRPMLGGPGPLYGPGRRRAPSGRAPSGGASGGRSPAVVAAAFAVAVVIGIVIGLVTAPSGKSTPAAKAKPGVTSPPEASPPLATPAWETHRVPGAVHGHVRVRDEDRTALKASLAAVLRTETHSAQPTTADVTIPQGTIFYGAVEGSSDATDVYWAVSPVQVVGATSASPQVWRRVGSAPWQTVARGPGACAQIPSQLLSVWSGAPSVC